MDNLTAIIVDDEPRARDVVRHLLAKIDPEIEVLAECGQLEEAVQAIKNKKPNVVFLDIEMPNYAGYEIGRFFDTIDFAIVFITAYDQFAIKAFELHAMDYLVKPIERKRFALTVERLKTEWNEKRKKQEYDALLESLKTKRNDKLILPEMGKRKIIGLSSLVFIEAQGAYTNFHMLDGEKHTTSKNLRYYENHLEGDERFMRIHRAYLINIDLVKSVNKSTMTVFMNGSAEVKISRGKMDDFFRKMSS